MNMCNVCVQNYLGEDYPDDQPVLSGGDQLTCERQDKRDYNDVSQLLGVNVLYDTNYEHTPKIKQCR